MGKGLCSLESLDRVAERQPCLAATALFGLFNAAAVFIGDCTDEVPTLVLVAAGNVALVASWLLAFLCRLEGLSKSLLKWPCGVLLAYAILASTGVYLGSARPALQPPAPVPLGAGLHLPLASSAVAAAFCALGPAMLFRALEVPNAWVLDVFVSSCNLGSDVFWLLTGSFYSLDLFTSVAAVLVLHGLPFVVFTFARGWPTRRLELPALSETKSRLWDGALLPLRQALVEPVEDCWGRNGDVAGLQHSGSLVVCVLFLLANLTFWLLQGLLALGVSLLYLLCGAANLLWALLLVCLGLLLHSARLLAFEPAFELYRAEWQAPDAGEGESLGEELPRIWQQMLISELLGEALPILGINLANIMLLRQEAGPGSVLSLLVSLATISRSVCRFILRKGVDEDGGPARPCTSQQRELAPLVEQALTAEEYPEEAGL